jgi:hypothetical protein
MPTPPSQTPATPASPETPDAAARMTLVMSARPFDARTGLSRTLPAEASGTWRLVWERTWPELASLLHTGIGARAAEIEDPMARETLARWGEMRAASIFITHGAGLSAAVHLPSPGDDLPVMDPAVAPGDDPLLRAGFGGPEDGWRVLDPEAPALPIRPEARWYRHPQGGADLMLGLLFLLPMPGLGPRPTDPTAPDPRLSVHLPWTPLLHAGLAIAPDDADRQLLLDLWARDVLRSADETFDPWALLPRSLAALRAAGRPAPPLDPLLLLRHRDPRARAAGVALLGDPDLNDLPAEERTRPEAERTGPPSDRAPRTR